MSLEPVPEPVECAELAFAAGDYVEVRRLCRELLAEGDPESVVRARDLLRRVSVDPVQIVVLALCFGLFLSIVAVYVL